MEPGVHGTAVAGIIAAHAELAGVAPQTHILSFRAFGVADPKLGMRGTTYDIVAGIEWSEQHGARIINMSFAGPPDPALSRELAEGVHRGEIFIAAVGDQGKSAKALSTQPPMQMLLQSQLQTEAMVFLGTPIVVRRLA
jgi:subtilisin family serine protease